TLPSVIALPVLARARIVARRRPAAKGPVPTGRRPRRRTPVRGRRELRALGEGGPSSTPRIASFLHPRSRDTGASERCRPPRMGGGMGGDAHRRNAGSLEDGRGLRTRLRQAAVVAV